jgi:hypothetical protein
MSVKAISFKGWCVENVSPQCWPRVLLKSLEALREEGLQLNTMENPPEDMILSESLFEALNNSLFLIYEIKIEEGILD